MTEEKLQNEGSVPIERRDLTSTVYSPNPLNNEDDGEFSLSDLANEYLHSEPSFLSVNEKLTSSLTTKLYKSEETSRTVENPIHVSSSVTNILTNVALPFVTNGSTVKTSLESILFPNCLLSNDAANDADYIWKGTSSLFGQILCTKITEIPIVATKQISTCLFDRSLYERLTRLITLLPKP